MRRRKSKKREPITDAEQAWLRGERDTGFTGFKADDYLQNLWATHGDPARFAWTVGELRPVARTRRPVGAVVDAVASA